MAALRPEEVWAQRIISQHLDIEVVVNDDGSAESMYDLRVGEPATPLLAIEVTAAIDQLWTQTWNAGPAKGSFTAAEVQGDWFVELVPGAHANTVRKRVPTILVRIEALGELDPADLDRYVLAKQIRDELEELGVVRANPYQPDGEGKITLTMAGSGGAVDRTGQNVPEWVGSFLRARACEDNLRKLDLPDAQRREIFIPVALSGAPWSVISYLTGDLEGLPSRAPDLPDALNGVWLSPTLTFTSDHRGVRWDGERWEFFRNRGPGIDDDDDET